MDGDVKLSGPSLFFLQGECVGINTLHSRWSVVVPYRSPRIRESEAEARDWKAFAKWQYTGPFPCRFSSSSPLSRRGHLVSTGQQAMSTRFKHGKSSPLYTFLWEIDLKELKFLHPSQPPLG